LRKAASSASCTDHDATLIVRRDAESLIRPDTLQQLADLKLGNDVVTMLDYRIRKEGQAPLQAARAWLDSERDRGTLYFLASKPFITMALKRALTCDEQAHLLRRPVERHRVQQEHTREEDHG
jgi:hypothetical protein